MSERKINLEEQFVTYEIALKLKELGFDEKCFKVYDELGFIQDEKEMDELNLIKLNAPLWQQVIDWFREKYNIHIWITYNREYDNPYFTCIVDISQINRITTGYCKEYSAAREQAILKAIELC